MLIAKREETEEREKERVEGHQERERERNSGCHTPTTNKIKCKRCVFL